MDKSISLHCTYFDQSEAAKIVSDQVQLKQGLHILKVLH